MMYTNMIDTLSHRALQNLLGISFPRTSPPEGWAVVDNTPPVLTEEEQVTQERSLMSVSRKQFKQQLVIADAVDTVQNAVAAVPNCCRPCTRLAATRSRWSRSTRVGQ